MRNEYDRQPPFLDNSKKLLKYLNNSCSYLNKQSNLIFFNTFCSTETFEKSFFIYLICTVLYLSVQ